MRLTSLAVRAGRIVALTPTRRPEHVLPNSRTGRTSAALVTQHSKVAGVSYFVMMVDLPSAFFVRKRAE